jgi:phenylpropionate dioxygenase-like ring-hydroxylating dioxygenase large terminal subunit
MRCQIPPSCYSDPDVFRREQERLFGRLWIFAGLRSFAATPDAFFTCVIAGRQVVVQNFDGAIKAFENVCLHRGKLIQTERFGRRPLVCGYHGWRYGDTGALLNVPFERECYRLTEIERSRLRLREFAVEVVGGLVFVNVGARPLPFNSQFSTDFIEGIASASNAFDDECLIAHERREFNWKLAYENLRDMIHPRFVHTKSLNLYAKFPMAVAAEGAPDPGDRKNPPPALTELSFGGPEGEIDRKRPPAFADWVARWGNTDAYFNWLLYPNTHILTSDGGYSFSLEHHRAISSTTTEVTTYYMTARKRRPVAWIAPTLWEMAKGAKRILDEDFDVLEEVQRGVSSEASEITQGWFELQNRKIERWYAENILQQQSSSGQST